MDKTIELKNNRKDDEAFAIFNTNRGKALMDEVNLFYWSIGPLAPHRPACASGARG
jgi:CHASE3 domain sensor protein